MARSDFDYILPSELPQFIHTMSGVTNEDVAAKFISEAEVIIDQLAGVAPKFYVQRSFDLSAQLASGTTTLQSMTFGSRVPGYWAHGGVYVEVTEGPAAAVGQRRLVVDSADNQVTLLSGFDVTLPVSGTTLLFKQESRFPRWMDQDVRGNPDMPFLLKRAVAYQVEFGILEGSEEFGLGDTSVATLKDSRVQSRSYGTSYSEVLSIIGAAGTERRGMGALIAPKARVIMRRLVNATGRLRA